MNSFSVAIVILNWNGKALLERFLPIVIENSNLPNVRIVVVDNASTDTSIDFVKGAFPQIQIIAFDQNYGFAKGYNKALSLLTDHYFILLNSDAVPEVGWIDPLFENIRSSEGRNILMPKILSHKNPSAFEYAGAGGGFIDRFGFPFCRGRIMDCVEDDQGQYNNSIEVFWASGAAFMIKGSLFNEIGGFDEHFFAHMEEIDLCWRLKNRGYKIFVVPESIVYHVGGASLHHSHPQKTFLNFRNNLYMLLKNLSPQSLIPILFIRMILDGIAALKFLFAFQFGFFFAVLRAHLSFYANLRLMISKRMGLKRSVKLFNHPEIYRGSIVFDYFIRKKTKFSDLKI